ncbi:MAG TPA: NAD(P)/FAD-dependent oxidoreductase [Acetobacteraceae bacterium]|nr:NAD(P)/FAD-dependent oxidoreductase [Acetobacteraceae bacterium]
MIIGAGFGGITAARSLARRGVEIVVIDRTNHHVFQPLLYQVATAALAASDISTPVRVMLRGDPTATVIMGDVTGIDPHRHVVTVADTGDFAYDYLIVSTGAAYSWFGHDEWAAHASVLKTLDDAETIRGRLLSAFERAESRGDPALTARLLTFVIVGGGPTGVELAGAIAELARSTLRSDFRRIRPEAARVVVCEGGSRVLAEFPPKLSDYAVRALGSLGVEIKLGATVSAIDADGVKAGGERIACANVFWCAGTAARPAAAWLGAPTARNGAVNVLPDCSVPEHPDVFVIGDGAHLTDDHGKPLPGLAAVAVQQGTYVARVIQARVAGGSPPGPFRYRNRGTLAVIGRSRAVADLGRIQLTGFPAWLFWSLVHLFLLAGFRNRLIVYINWSWAWLTYGRGARVIISTAPMHVTADKEKQP